MSTSKILTKVKIGLRIFSIPLITIGLLGFLTAAASSVGFLSLPKGFEAPNAFVSDIEVSKAGDIFIASPAWGRVNKYSTDGTFVTGWAVDSSGGKDFCLASSDNSVFVTVGSFQPSEEFDLHGNALAAGQPSPSRIDMPPCRHSDRVLLLEEEWNTIQITLAGSQAIPMTIRPPWWHYLMLNILFSMALAGVGLITNPDWVGGILRAIAKRNKPFANTEGRTSDLAKYFNALKKLWTGLFFALMAGIFIFEWGEGLFVLFGAAYLITWAQVILVWKMDSGQAGIKKEKYRAIVGMVVLHAIPLIWIYGM